MGDQSGGTGRAARSMRGPVACVSRPRCVQTSAFWGILRWSFLPSAPLDPRMGATQSPAELRSFCPIFCPKHQNARRASLMHAAVVRSPGLVAVHVRRQGAADHAVRHLHNAKGSETLANEKSAAGLARTGPAKEHLDLNPQISTPQGALAIGRPLTASHLSLCMSRLTWRV